MASAPPMESEENIIRSPELPFVSAIVGGLFPGRAIVVSGMVQQGFAADSKRFCIDLCCGLLIQGDHMDNKALHFNPRFDSPGGWFSGTPDRQLVLNTFVSNSWGQEERFANPFEEGKPFQIRILVLDNYFKIAVNGRHVCDFAHRVPVEQVKTIFIQGNIRVDFVEFQPAIVKNLDGHPVAVPSQPAQQLKTNSIDRPDVPFSFPLPDGFVSPQSVRFTVTPFISGKRFSLNLFSCGEFLFHFRVDMPNGKEKPAVVRNSTLGGQWQTEERQMGAFPFHRGITSDVTIHAYGRSIAVDVDGLPFCKFAYRRDSDDPSLMDRVTVEGDVVLQRFVHRGP